MTDDNPMTVHELAHILFKMAKQHATNEQSLLHLCKEMIAVITQIELRLKILEEKINDPENHTTSESKKSD